MILKWYFQVNDFLTPEILSDGFLYPPTHLNPFSERIVKTVQFYLVCIYRRKVFGFGFYLRVIRVFGFGFASRGFVPSGLLTNTDYYGFNPYL